VAWPTVAVDWPSIDLAMGLSVSRIHSLARPPPGISLDLPIFCPLVDLSLLYSLSTAPKFGSFLHQLEPPLSMGLSILVMVNVLGASLSLPYAIQSCLERQKEKQSEGVGSSS